MLQCLGQSPPWSRWEGVSHQQGFSLPVYNWPDVFRKGFFVFPFGSPLLLLWHQGQAAAGKLWAGLEVQGRRKLFCLLPACCSLFIPQAGSRQAKETGFLVVPLHLLICVRSGTCPWAQAGWSIQVLHSQKAELQNHRIPQWVGRDHSGSPDPTPCSGRGSG